MSYISNPTMMQLKYLLFLQHFSLQAIAVLEITRPLNCLN